MVIFDGVPVPALTQGNFILINTLAPNLPLRPSGTIKRRESRPTVTAGATLTSRRSSPRMRSISAHCSSSRSGLRPRASLKVSPSITTIANKTPGPMKFARLKRSADVRRNGWLQMN